ncbi:MAG: bifunctional serine/threonine-protein kinase/formylglycine-generating enzyme family protein [Pseudomonadota bacterium]|nr:bifunctional serine/threonine-protein kinase/formylglycine-generating enzyme family protein [Pseudomonadota bacterium]
MALSAFAHALRAFQSGELAYDDLTSEIGRQLTVERASPQALLDILDERRATQPLPAEVHEAIALQITGWPEEPTVATGVRCEGRGGRAAGVGVGNILQGRFSLIALIGEGGMSRVFKAIDLRRAEAGAADPYVAVKVLTEPFDQYFGSVVALQREAHKLQSMTHPNIVRVIDCDRDGQTVFMTMEYLAGRSLHDILRSSRAAMEPARALSLVAAVGDAVAYAHANHIVHGDLKPGNVIVTAQGPVKVIDFGMAKFIARADRGPYADAANDAAPKAITPRYASPQMAAGKDPEPADDVYALACMAYTALTGRHPFGRQRDPQYRLPRPPHMPKHQYRALARALAFEREQRTPTVRRFLDELLATRRRGLTQLRAGLATAAVMLLLAATFWIHPSQTPSAISAADPVVRAAAAGSVIRDCPTCPALTVLPPGRFAQGADATAGHASAFELPRHAVVIGYPLALGSNEITVAEFGQFIAETHRPMSGCETYDGRWQFRSDATWQWPGFEQSATHPVTCVSWDDAVAYTHWLSDKSGYAYRLPSASEWEYAARAGTEAPLPWSTAAAACGEANVADQSAQQRFPGWDVFPCNDRHVNTAPVGSFKANAFGLNDLFGNVLEWVQDCWYDSYQGAPTDGSARVEEGCGERELRGGSWFTAPRYVSASYRTRFDHAYRSSSTGFRVAREMSRPGNE